MGRKLHPRFCTIGPGDDREDFRCESCEKARAQCRDCSHCSECCQCEYCDLCGLPNGHGFSECVCFQCEDCYRTCPEDDQVLDDGNYANPSEVDARKPIRYLCTACYAKREAAWKASLTPIS